MAHPQLPALESLAQSVAEPLGFRIHHLLLHSHRSPQALIVALQRQEGQQVTDVNLDDCATFSAAFAEALDLGELLAGAYVLEITSPGVGDVLQDDRDFRSFRGFPVSVLQHDANGDQLIKRCNTASRHTSHGGRPTMYIREVVANCAE